MEVRALLPEELAAARALVLAQFGGTRYEARMLELLHAANEGGETSCAVARDGSGKCAGVLLSTTVAGAAAVERVECVLGSNGATSALTSSLRERGGVRLFVAELPDDVSFRTSSLALSASGFVLEGRIAGFVAEGIDLRIYAMDAGSAAT